MQQIFAPAREAPNFSWHNCVAINLTTLSYCGFLFTLSSNHSRFVPTVGLSEPKGHIIATFTQLLHDIFEPLVLFDTIAFSDDGLSFVSIDGEKIGRGNLAWLGAATKHFVPIGISDKLFDEEIAKHPVLPRLLAYYRDKESYHHEQIKIGTRCNNSRQMNENFAAVAQCSEAYAYIRLRLMCDYTGMSLWATPTSSVHHTYCITQPPASFAVLRQLQAEVANLRRRLLDSVYPSFQAAGSDVHCNVEMSPIILALVREAKDPQDLINVALQFRDAAKPFREYLAQSDEKQQSEEDYLWLADWRQELQSVCNAVAKALGLTAPSPGNLGSAVFNLAEGNPMELVNNLVEQAPPSLRRHLLHPIYLNPKKAFLRKVVYDAVLAPELTQKLEKIFKAS